MTTASKSTGKIFVGKVVSDKMAKTVVVQMDYTSRHPQYKKIVKKRKKLYAENTIDAKMGDTVKVRETRPLSKLKRFITVEVIK